MDTIKLSIVTPTGSIFNGDVKTVTLPGKEGEFGVLPGHSSLVSTLSVGVIVIEKIDSTEAVAINWGHGHIYHLKFLGILLLYLSTQHIFQDFL